MNLALYTGLNLRRMLADRSGIFFSVLLPVAFYLIFGALQSYADMPLNEGTVGGYVMIGMACYGGIIAASATAGTVSVEQSTGWGRQLALTPLTPIQRLASQAAVVLVRAALPVLAVCAVGMLAGTRMPVGQWVGCAVLTVLVALPFGFYGMAFGLLFRSESAVSISSTALVVLAFLGNAFMPLTAGLLAIGRFTPMYGPMALARWPLARGVQSIGEDPYVLTDPLWYAIINCVGWTLVFAGCCALLLRRQKGRQ